MCTGVTLLCRQRLDYQLVFLVFIQLHQSSLTDRSLQGCVGYPEACKTENDFRNNCSCTLKDQICHYSRNDSLQQSDLLSLFGKHEDLPESPNNFSIGVNYNKSQDDSPSIPTLKFRWKMPLDKNSTKSLNGFVLNISFIYNNKNRQKVRIFVVENKLLNDAMFEYECRAIPGVSYSATIYSLPTNLQNFVTQTVSVNCSDPFAQRKVSRKWKATMDASVLRNGSVSVYFIPAPINYNFSTYSVWLSTKSDSCRHDGIKYFLTRTRIPTLCPEQGHIILNPTGLDVHEEYKVCIQPEYCGCWITALDVGLIVPTTEETTTSTKTTTTTKPTMTTTTRTTMTTRIGNIMPVNVPITLSPDDTSLPDGAIVIGLVVGLLLIVVLLVLVLSVRRIYRMRRHHCQTKGLNATKKYLFLIYGNDVKLYDVHVIDRLSAFLELCNKYEVISIDGCSNVRVLKRRIALADSVLIIRSATDAAGRYATSDERRDSGHDSESMPIDDNMFHSAIEIIRREFQSEVTYMKFCQIMLPCYQDRSAAEVGLPDLKVKKNYQLMEFIEELWRNNQTMSCISESNADDFRKSYEVFKELGRTAANTNCCGSCRSKTCQHNDERNEYKQSFNDSGVSSTYFLAEASLTQHCCAGLGDTKAQMARSAQCHFMCRSVDRINCSLLEVERQHENNLESTMRYKQWQCSKKEINSEEYFFFESSNSSSESISFTTFFSNAVKLNDEFDRHLESDGIFI